MVEAMANSVEDRLIDGLSFKLDKGASYITDRRSVTFHPQGSNVYTTSSGTRLIKINLTGDGWVDPSTVRVMFNVQNDETDAAKRLRPLSGPHSFFRRLRVLCGGQVVEDIDNYNRVHEMMNTLVSKHSRQNEDGEAFGLRWNAHDWINSQVDTDNFKGIAQGESQTVLFKPLSGLLNQPKYLPIRYMPLVLELELVDKATEPIVSNFSGTGATDFKADNTSLVWSLNQVQVKCDMCTLDNSLDNSYAEHLLSGKSLPINYNTFVSQMQTILGQDKPSINVSRALTRLKSVFVTLDKDLEGTNAGSRAALVGRKQFNDFFSPMHQNNGGGELQHVAAGEFEFHVQIGSKLFPEYPIRSHAEAYYQLKKTLGVQSSNVHSFDITAAEYRDNKLILGIDTEKVLEAGFTGLNTRSGDLMTVKLSYADKGSAVGSTYSRLADRMHIVLHSDQIVEVRDTGVTVYD